MPSERERGAALLTVLLLIAIIAVLAGAALERLRLTTRLAGNALAGEQARGFARAAEALATSRITTMLGDAPDRVTLAGGWSGRPFGLPLPGGGLAVARVRDGGNCFNLNGLVSRLAPNLYTSSQNFAQRLQFVRLMQAIGVPTQAADHIAAATADSLLLHLCFGYRNSGIFQCLYRRGKTRLTVQAGVYEKGQAIFVIQTSPGHHKMGGRHDERDFRGDPVFQILA